MGVALTSHLLSLASRTVTVGSRCLKARLYGWLPLSKAYGISFIATPYPIFRIPRCEIYHQSLFLVAIHPQFIGILSKIRGTILDLTYSALKVHQNTGRGEVKRNPCLECANRLVPKTRQNLCHPAGVLLTVS